MLRFLRELTALPDRGVNLGSQIATTLLTESSLLSMFLNGYFGHSHGPSHRSAHGVGIGNPALLCHQRQCLLIFWQMLAALMRPIANVRKRPCYQDVLHAGKAADDVLKFECLRSSPLFPNLGKVISTLVLCLVSNYCVPDSFCGKAVTRRALHSLYMCSLVVSRQVLKYPGWLNLLH